MAQFLEWLSKIIHTDFWSVAKSILSLTEPLIRLFKKIFLKEYPTPILPSPKKSSWKDCCFLMRKPQAIVETVAKNDGHQYYRIPLQYPVMTIAFKPNSRCLAVGSGSDSFHGAIHIIDCKTGSRKELHQFKESIPISISYSPKGNYLASLMRYKTGKDRIFLWNARYKPLFPINIHELVGSMEFTPDNKFIVTSGEKGIKIWDPKNGNCCGTLLPGSWSKAPNPISLSHDDKYLAYTPDQKCFAIMDLSSKIKLEGFQFGSIITDLKFSHHNKLLAICFESGAILFWDVNVKKRHLKQVDHRSIIKAISFSPKDDVLASAGRDSLIKLWHTGARDIIRSLKFHDGPINSVCFSPDGSLLASGGEDKTVVLWRTN